MNFHGPNGDVNDPDTQEDESQRTIADWIIEQTGLNQARSNNPTGGSFDDPDTWAYGNTPGAGAAVTLNVDTADGAVFTPGTGVSSFGRVGVGGGEGVKAVVQAAGQSLTLTGSLGVTTNGSVRLESGDLEAARLTIDALTPVFSGPAPQAGLFRWTDVSGLGPSNLRAGEVVVDVGGTFIHDWLDPATGTLAVDRFEVRAGGRAFFQWNTTGITALENAGLVSVGESVAGNGVVVATFSQTNTGALALFVGGFDPVSQSVVTDQVAVTGSALLGGELALFVERDALPGSGQPAELIYGDVLTLLGGGASFDGVFSSFTVGTYDDATGPTPGTGLQIAPGFSLAVVYALTGVSGAEIPGSGVSAVVALPGDGNLDGIVSQADLDAVLLNWGTRAATWATGDYSGDGFVSQVDLDAVLLNWAIACRWSSGRCRSRGCYGC